MPSIENSFSRDPYASLYHRLTGRYSLYTDIDLTITEEGQMENTNLDYCYQNGKRKRVALLDYKRMNKDTVTTQKVGTYYYKDGEKKNIDAMLCQIDLANDLNLPFFIVCTYLDDAWTNKQYLLIPINQIAKDFFLTHKQDVNGQWMSLRKYAQFHHLLRNKPFDTTEEINKASRWNDHIKLSNDSSFTLGQLPATIDKTYDKPIINL